MGSRWSGSAAVVLSISMSKNLPGAGGEASCEMPWKGLSILPFTNDYLMLPGAPYRRIDGMKYLLMCCTQEKDWAAMPADERHSHVEETLAYCRVLWEGGHLLAAEPLEPVAAAMTLRVRGGEVSVTDGPFAETRDQLGGYFLVEAKELDAAIAIAARIPMARKGTVAVRPVIDIPGLPTSLSVALDVYFRNSSKNPSSTSNVCFGTTPSSSFSNVSRSVSPSTSSIGGPPSRLASFLASSVNVPVVRMMPLSARPIMAPLKSRTCEGATAPL